MSALAPSATVPVVTPSLFSVPPTAILPLYTPIDPVSGRWLRDDHLRRQRNVVAA
jgi:hypothetical protein